MAGTSNNREGYGGQLIPIRRIDARKWEKTDSSMVKVSIFDIPDDRYQEAVDHMCEYFLADDFICKSFKIKDDQTAVNDFRTLFLYILWQKMSIGAFRVNPDESLGELVGMNLLYIPTVEHEKWINDHTTKSTSAAFFNMFTYLREMSAEVDIRKVYGVKEYLAGMGLSMKPNYRNHGIEMELLEARKYIGLRHNLTVTAGFFTDSEAQYQANGARFNSILNVRYAGAMDRHGSPLFPNVKNQELLKLMAVKTVVM